MIVLVGATYYVKFSEESQLAIGYASASIAFVTYIGILPYLPATEAHQTVEEGAQTEPEVEHTKNKQ